MSPYHFIAQLPLPKREIQLRRNEFLCQPGQFDQNIYLINAGALIIYIDAEASEQIIRFAYEDNVIVCLDAFFGNRPTDFYVQAIKKSTILAISKIDLLKYIEENPSFYTVWLSMLESLIVQQMEREIDLLTVSPKERLERVLARSPQLFQKIPHKYIANYLRMSPETLSRIQKY